MKKLFTYALEIKNSHNRLKGMITAIDGRRREVGGGGAKGEGGSSDSRNNSNLNGRNDNTSGNLNERMDRPQEHIP